ncbi:UNVERIFIED_CONTAM: Multidrug resistance-associated protein 4 [Gekko kuhli]
MKLRTPPVYSALRRILLQILEDWWLSYWANQQEKLNNTTEVTSTMNEVKTLDLRWYLGIYAGLTVATILFSVLRCLLVFHVLVNSAQTLHDKMFQSILKAPVLFFDRNPIGSSKYHQLY